MRSEDSLSISLQYSQPQIVEGVANRHSSLWFIDGSVVLKAENTLFRVHISQLSRRSLFFRDLFSLPQPQQDQNQPAGWIGCDGTYDGCPLLVLHDSAEDLANLLLSLYDGGP